MPVIVSCGCGARFQAPDHLLGQRVTCPACGGPLDVPGPSITQSWATAAPQQFPPAATPSHATRSDNSRTVLLAARIGAGIVVLILVVVGASFFRSAGQPVAQQPQATSDFNAPPETPPMPVDDSQPRPFRSQSHVKSSRPNSSQPDSAGQPAAPRSDGPPDVGTEPLGEPPATEATETPLRTADSGSGQASGEMRLSSAVASWHMSTQQPLRGVRRAGDRSDAPVMLNYSWMTETLPYLGYQEVYDKFDFTQSWSTDDNLRGSAVLIPEFLNPQDDRQRWSGYPYDGMPLTHFVGMSGLEMGRNDVAARLPRSDVRAGMFGYEQVARREEISDGTSHTIAIIGSGEIVAPWVQAGGATIRGAREPYFDRLTGFGSRGLPKPGAMAVFADGSVQTISADIDPEVFRALSTIHGGETVDLSRLSE